jgi:tetratricopeptide (TPR) repeat protein
MLNETITFLSGVDIYFLAAFFGIISVVIAIFMFFLGVLPHIKSKKDFSDLFIYRKAKKLQQNDFAIQQPLNANAEVYKRRESDEEVENSPKKHENVLVTGMPKSGKTRSVYEAIKAVFPDFFVIKVPPKGVEQIGFPFLKRNYLVFFDDLNEFISVKFDFNSFLKKVKKKSKKLIVVSTCRSGDELTDVKNKYTVTWRTFTKVVDLDKYELSEIEGRELAEEAGVKWKPEQFQRTPGSVILDDEDMKTRYRNSTDYEKSILRACKLLKRANIFTYEKKLIRELCTSIFGTQINEKSWINSINHLKENSLVTKSSIPEIDVYDNTLESVVDDYDPVYHLEALLNLLIKLGDAENLFYLGNAFYKDKNYENGEKSYKECLRINPESANAHINLGILLKNLKRYEESEREYREAIRIKPDLAEAHINLGILLYDLKRYKESEREYREAIRIKPDLAEAHINLGLLLDNLKRYKESEREYREAIRINPDLAEAHFNLGILLKDLKRYEESEREYREAIRINPDYVAAHYNLGILLKDLKRYEESEREYREAIGINPDYVAAHFNLGILLKDLKRYEESEREYREAIGINPDYVAAHFNLGLLLDNLKRYKESEREYREAIRIKPNLAEAHNNLGILLYDLKRYKESEREYREAIRIKPDLAEAHANLGILFSKTEKKEEAKKELRIAKELFEGDGREEDVKKMEELLKLL